MLDGINVCIFVNFQVIIFAKCSTPERQANDSILFPRLTQLNAWENFDSCDGDGCGVVVGIVAYYTRGRGFDSRTVETFVCMNKSVCIGSGCFDV
jgi:hypothetical protein